MEPYTNTNTNVYILCILDTFREDGLGRRAGCTHIDDTDTLVFLVFIIIIIIPPATD